MEGRPDASRPSRLSIIPPFHHSIPPILPSFHHSIPPSSTIPLFHYSIIPPIPMLLFDQLKKNDPQLRLLALVILGGLGVLLAGLWWVQVVSAKDYQAHLETQSFRTVRIPAVRGRILDRNGNVLAENRPTYNICMYLDELRKPFDARYTELAAAAGKELKREQKELQKKLNRSLKKQEKRQFILTMQAKDQLRQQARMEVASNVVAQISQRLQLPIPFSAAKFEAHYRGSLALPFVVLSNLDPTNIARFEEESISPLGVDLDVQSTRCYPHGTTAAHLLGHLQRDDASKEGEDASFSYWLPDYRGALGIELAYDKELRGMAGAKSVQVNNMGYRTMENIWTPAEPGRQVVLTLDLDIQQAAEHALPTFGPNTRGAAVVMDVRTGDVLALASVPTFDPNYFSRRSDFPKDYYETLSTMEAEKNRATHETYPPGSIFKTVDAMALLDAGLDPRQEIEVEPNHADPMHGYYRTKSGHVFRDLAKPGFYDFKRALMKSCNTYFITQAVRYGPECIVQLAQHLHFGERFGLHTAQESRGCVPLPSQLRSGWSEVRTGNMAIGQDPVLVTPLQIAVLMSAIANGGQVLYPRLVSRIESEDPLSGPPPQLFEAGRVRDELGVSARSMDILHKAMLGDTEDPEGTGLDVRKHAPLTGLHICAKTGTAQIQGVHNELLRHITWFGSFAPYEQPRYAVVVMIENGGSGGHTCAPIAGLIYKAILDEEAKAAPKPNATLAGQ
jgi:penicillin-binding protein 2